MFNVIIYIQYLYVVTCYIMLHNIYIYISLEDDHLGNSHYAGELGSRIKNRVQVLHTLQQGLTCERSQDAVMFLVDHWLIQI